MKNRFVRVTVVTIIVSIFYFVFFQREIKESSEKKSEFIENEETKLDTLLNEKGYLVIGKPNVVKLVKASDTVNYKDFFIIETYKEDAFVAKKQDKDYLEIYKEFSLVSKFNQYRTPVYNGKLANPNFASNPEAKMFKTRITEGCKEGVNFAGHYTLLYWGCGTSCQYGVIVDRKTGEIIDGYQSTLGSEFRKDSKLIILNSDYIEGNKKYIPLYQFKKFDFRLWENDLFTPLED